MRGKTGVGACSAEVVGLRAECEEEAELLLLWAASGIWVGLDWGEN